MADLSEEETNAAGSNPETQALGKYGPKSTSHALDLLGGAREYGQHLELSNSHYQKDYPKQ